MFLQKQYVDMYKGMYEMIVVRLRMILESDNSLRHWNLVNIGLGNAFRLLGAKPLPGLMLTCCQLNLPGTKLSEILIKTYNFPYKKMPQVVKYKHAPVWNLHLSSATEYREFPSYI